MIYTTGGTVPQLWTTTGLHLNAAPDTEAPGVDDLPTPPEAPHPYPLPSAAPWVVPNAAITPTYDGSGSAVHPSVVDIVAETGQPFRGFRYWMGMTPYYQSNDQLENPSILASNGGYEWHVPDGLTNPLDGPPPTGWYSDTHLAWDPEHLRFVLYWRSQNEGHHAAESTDGVHWTIHRKVTTDTAVSCSVVRRGPYDWWLFLGSPDSAGGARFTGYRSASPLGPWVDRQDADPLTGAAANMWHSQVIWDAQTEHWFMLGSNRERAAFPAVSADGITWTAGPNLFVDGYTYRATLTPADDPAWYEVWYSAQVADALGDGGWWIKHTRLPRAAWTNLI